jgi:hypothetical protein
MGTDVGETSARLCMCLEYRRAKDRKSSRVDWKTTTLVRSGKRSAVRCESRKRRRVWGTCLAAD